MTNSAGSVANFSVAAGVARVTAFSSGEPFMFKVGHFDRSVILLCVRWHLNNRIEQDHRRIKRRVRPMLGFKSFASAGATLIGIETIHMMRKRQARYAYNPHPSVAEQFEIIAAV
jgi:transposase-like protein